MIVYVIVVAAGVTVLEEKVKQEPEPALRVIVAATVAPVLNEKPDGAVKIIVPLPGVKTRPVVSVIVGPASIVHVAVPFVVLVSALIAPPPVAGVAVTAAKTLFTPAKNKTAAAIAKKAVFLCINFIFEPRR